MTYSQRDKEVNWHPFTQMQDSADFPCIVKAEGVWLIDEEGKKYLDGISSWWVNILGHCNPKIASAIAHQAQQLDQVIFANFTHPGAVELSERLLTLLPGEFSKGFFSDDGSTSVEVGIKMAIQFFHNKGIDRRRIIAFEHAYHGDTFGSMSVSGRSGFNQPFESLLFDVDFIPVPVKGREEEALTRMAEILQAGEHCLFLFEPLVQGSAGMVMYEPDILDQLIILARSKGVLIMADEVFTGFGRTGTWFACDQLTNKPDIIAVSKGITGGFLPLGYTAATDEVYSAFLSDDFMKTFFHGHSYTCNPISVAAALATLDQLDKALMERISQISLRHAEFCTSVAELSRVKEARSKGTILAIELRSDEEGYFSNERKKILHHFMKKGLLLRPLGNVVYLLPPFVISDEELSLCYREIRGFLEIS